MKKYSLSLLFLFCGLFLYGQQYVSVSPSSISVPLEGGTYTCSVDYTISPDSLMNMDFIRYATTSSQVSSVTGNSHKQFTIVFKANSGYTPVSGTVTVYYRDPQNMSNEIFGTLSFTQPAATPDYTISIAPASISVDPYGGTQKLKVSYVYMQEAVNLTYLGATGLPAGCTLSAGTNGELTLRCDRNATGTDRNATVTVRYQNPRDAAHPVTASFKMYQSTVPSWVAITPESVTVKGTGEEKSFNLQYAVDSTVTYECLGYSGDQGQVQSYRIANNQLYVNFKKNQTNSTISGNITFTFRDPVNSALTISDAIAFSQTPASYAVTLSENSVSIPSAGGNKTLTASYVERDNPVTLSYRSSSGLPSWCTLTAGANGALALSCTANTTNAARSATVTVSYNNPLNASQPVTASFSLSQQPLSYNITIPNNSLSIAAAGETKNLSLAYVDRTGTVSLTYQSCSGLPAGATVTAGSNGTFSVAFPSNTTSATRSGTATIYYTNPLNSSQPVSATFTYSQQPLSYNITIPNNSLSVAAAGETKTLSLVYVDRTGTVSLTYQSCTGLPAGATVTANSNGTFSVAFPSNTTNTTRSGTATISYNNPINSSQPVSATFTYSQQPLSYNITIPNNSLSVAAAGETKTLSLAYVDRTGTVSLTYQSCSGLPAGATVTANGNGTFSVTFPGNTANTALSGTATIYYTNPLNSSQPVSATFTYSQQPLPYNITIPNNSLSVAAAGETKTLSLAYVDRTGTVSLTYQSCTGLPAGATVTANGNGTFSVTFPGNTANTALNGTVTIYYANPLSSSQPVSATFTYSQQPLSYNITIPNNSLSVAAAGETKTVTLAYTQRPGTVELTFQSSSGVPDWCTLTPGSGGTLSASCAANSGNTVRSATITVSYVNPLNSAQPVTASFSLSQQPQSYAIRASSSSYSITPEGGSTTVSIVYAERTGSMDLAYQGCSGIPDWCVFTAGSGGRLTLSAQRNITGVIRYADLTVSYANPLNSAQPVTASFSVSQEPMSSWVTLTPKSVEVSGAGETKTLSIAYSVDSLVSFECTGYNGDQGQIQSCRVINGSQLAVEFKKNQTSSPLSGNITFNFKDPAGSAKTLSDVIAFTQQPAEYRIRFEQSNVDLASAGGTQALSVVYEDRTGPVALTYKSAIGLPEGWSITSGADGQLTLSYGANGLTSLGSGSITVYYENPLDGNNPVSATLAYTQQPDNYAVSFSTSQASVPAGGGGAEIDLAYTYRTDAFALSYDHADNLPAWCTISQQGTKLNLQVSGSNDGTQSRSATVTVHFTNQSDASKPVSATLTVEQPPLDFSLSASPQYVTIDPEGGSQSVTLSYQNREGSVTLDYLGTSGLPEGCSASFANSALSVTATPNYRGPDRYAEATASFTDPLGGSPVTVSFSVSQPTYAGYWIEIPTERFTVDAGGGSYEYDFAFGPTDSIQTMPTPRLGEPVDSQVDKANFRPATQNGQKGIIAFKSNTTGQTINGTVVLEYPDPTDHSKMLTHAISFTQASALPTAQQQSTTERIYTDETGTAYNSTVTYYDGLYRQEQTVQVGTSPAGGDIVSFVEYDCMGRADSVSYLPFVTTAASGAKVSDPLSEQTAFYSAKFGTGQGDYARSYKTYDDSPLGFVLNQTSPGEYRSFSGYYTHFGYRLNTQADAIRRYRMEGDSSLKFDGYYAAERLTVKRVLATKDNATEAEQAQRQESYEYTNAQGQVIAKEVRVSESDRRMTYYVYDDLGQQRYVLPPAQHEALTDGTIYTPSQLHKLSYYTEYDDKGQAVRQWNPGTDCVYSLYDLRGRLSMTQSGKQRTANEWSFTKYDRMDRPVLSGVVTGGTFESHKAALDAATVLYEERGSAVHGYTNQSYPSATAESAYLSVTYYDDYDWLTENDPHGFSTADALGGTPNYRVQGQSTGSKSKVLGIETDRWLTTAAYFDSDYQAIQSVADLYPSGTEITSNTHDFTGNVTRTKVKQTVDNTVYEYDKWFEFDAFGRLQQVSQQIAGDGANGKVVLASYTYDELGRTAAKAIHNGLETESYAYDLTGRTNAVTSPSFSYALDYEQSAVAGAVPRLDGNVSAMRWGSATSTDKAYAYAYDRVGQLQSADYKLLSGGVWSPSANYKESGLTYDLNGNILSVQRTGGSGESLHALTNTYDGYRLLSVGVNGTASDSYLYDADGNMTFDGRRGLTIAYNTLNLPEEIVAGNQKINYIYSASGEKLACDANGSLTYYRSVMVYGHDDKLLYMLTPEGTVSRSEGSAGTSYTYNYFKTDHLGSTRVMLSAVDGTLQASQTTDFYPFGLAFEYSNLNKNKYLFSGKELQDGNLGGSTLEWYDFGARFYDPMLGRWFNVDPAAQVANPYLFCGNAPMMYIDKDGRLFWLIPVLGAVIGGAMNVISHLDDIHNFWGALGYFGVGAAVGAASAYAGGWIADASKALGLFPGMLVGGAMGGATGAASSFLLTGMSNVVGGQNFMSNMGGSVTSGLLSGFISGAISGGIKGFKAAKKVGANPLTGSKIDENSIVTYMRNDLEIKAGVPAQLDDSEFCYGYTLEYADKGHGNRDAAFFIEKANNRKGYDPSLVADKVDGMNPKAYIPSRMDVKGWEQLGGMLNRNAEIIGTYGANLANSHAVNIVGLQFGQKLRIFGGGLGKLKLLNSTIWNPTGGKYQTIKPMFNKITHLRY